MVAIKKPNMDKIKVIKTEEDYKEALALLEELMVLDPVPDTAEGEKLDLLATLIEAYESTVFPNSLPDPVDAILFRMEQANLKPADLVPYIGSRSKVSEILSRKRPLTLAMMRSLQDGLGIPAKVLLRESNALGSSENIAWQQFPIKEMEKRGYFGQKKLTSSNLNQVLESFFGVLGTPTQAFGLLRKTSYLRASRAMDRQALAAWSARIAQEGKKIKYSTKYKKGAIDFAFMQKLAQLSIKPNGPKEAIKFLSQIGVGLVIEPHFPKTYLDGAVLLKDKGHPVIGLTLRHNRVDNFWFTLMHELSHIVLHSDTDTNLFYDDLDNADASEIEKQADKYAGEALVPESKWQNSPARILPTALAAESLARELGIHTAIVAGKMRREGQQYHYLGTIVNEATVQNNFPEKNWGK